MWIKTRAQSYLRIHPLFNSISKYAFKISYTNNESRPIAIMSVTSALAMMTMVGIALRWEYIYVIVSVVSFSLSVWIAKSISRAVMCIFAAFGIMAIFYSLLAAYLPNLLDDGHVSWSLVSTAVWIVCLGLALCARLSSVKNGYSFSELIGCWASTFVAAVVALKIVYSGSLLPLLLSVEDNAAWVSVVTQIHGAKDVTTYGVLGPVFQLYEGLLLEQQQTVIPHENVVFSSYSLLMILVPMITATLFRQRVSRSKLSHSAFLVTAILWAYEIPIQLAQNNGHLTAIIFSMSFLLVAGVLAFEEDNAWSTFVSIFLIFFMGSIWYPVIPLGFFFLCLIGYRLRSSASRRTIITGFTLIIAALMGFYEQLSLVLNVSSGDGIQELQTGLTTVFASSGGTSAIDPLTLALTLVAFISLGCCWDKIDGRGKQLWLVVVLGLAYVAIVIIGANALKTLSGYGPVKLEFLVGFSVIPLLIAVTARLRVSFSAPAFGSILIGLVLIGFATGPFGSVISRVWPGDGARPGWLQGVSKISQAEGSGNDFPTACYSNDKWQAYFCSRWVAAVTVAGDSVFLPYRLQFVNDLDTAGAIEIINKNGDLRRSAVIVLDLPDEGHYWGWNMIYESGRIYDIAGSEISVADRRTIFGWDTSGNTRWAKPAKEVVDRILSSSKTERPRQILCLGLDVAENNQCSAFSTFMLGGRISQDLVGIAGGTRKSINSTIVAGSLDDVAVLELESPSHSMSSLWQLLVRAARTAYRARLNGTTELMGTLRINQSEAR